MATEKRLIDANVVLAKQFTSGLSDASGNYYGHADVIFADDIANAPTVDAVEVVHGRWVHHYNDSGEPIDDKWYCSECHMCNDHKRTWYCPNCGAKMDGDGNG